MTTFPKSSISQRGNLRQPVRDDDVKPDRTGVWVVEIE